MKTPAQENTTQESEEVIELQQKLKDLNDSLREADKLNSILNRRVQKLESRVEELSNSKTLRVSQAVSKIKFILSTAGGKKGLLAKIFFFFSPLGLKLVAKLFSKSFNFLISKIQPARGEVVENQDPYQAWMEKNFPGESELKGFQNTQNFFKSTPLISVIYPVAHQAEPVSVRTIQSVLNQVYENWELIVVTDKRGGKKAQEVIQSFCKEGQRVKITGAGKSHEVADLINEGLLASSGMYFTVVDHNDTFSPDALYQYVLLLNENPDAELIYGDEDKLKDDTHSDPLFKPGWSPDTLLSGNYLGTAVLFHSGTFKEIGHFNKKYKNSYLYDAILKFTEVSNKIFHIDKVVYHSCPEDWSSNSFSHYSDLQVLQDTVKRRKLAATVESVGVKNFSIRYQIKEYKKVSIIIPTKDKAGVLDTCLNSVFEKSTYPDFEVIVLDNNSNEAKTFELFNKYRKLQGNRFKVKRIEIPFNYSKINNLGVREASGDYILLLNNDTEVINTDWLEAMVEQVQRPTVGAVGVKLLYPDRKVQHAGMVIGLEYGGNTFVGKDGLCGGYMNFINMVRNYSAVTAACLMVRKSVFEEVGGLDEGFAVEFNDTDFCLRLREAGYNNIYLPYVELIHYESLSRGYVHLSKEGLERHNMDLAKIQKRWNHYFENDPCYNRNLSKDKGGFGISL